jgi:hypothetical protein
MEERRQQKREMIDLFGKSDVLILGVRNLGNGERFGDAACF